MSGHMPWRARNRHKVDEYPDWTVEDTRGYTVAEILSDADAEQKARLFAAAPEMLEALKDTLACGLRTDEELIHHAGICPCIKCRLKAIIAKAEGRGDAVRATQRGMPSQPQLYHCKDCGRHHWDGPPDCGQG